MPAIGDSDAFRDRDRILPQHQAALTLLQAILSNPERSRVRWLDLACGRGQIIGALEDNLSVDARSNLEYWGYDVDQRFARETRRLAQRVKFASLEVRVGDLSDFAKILPQDLTFDFVTLTNTVHEVAPAQLAAVFVDCVLRLSDTGTLFVYDIERLRPPELGAIPWSREEIRRIVEKLLNGLGARYRLEVALWPHRTLNAWNFQLQREHLGLSAKTAVASRKQAVEDTQAEIVDLLKSKLASSRDALENLTVYGAETAEEQADRERLLFEFWAVSRALRGVQ